ncbi:IS66 family insertion sequence element accessory protein TnpB [uncultured Paraglaciecola sp.]|uniref:IS66 family insertion sequence element accessory protein TnpB n=1 Tax=uncultured Paraglaciecola sp. TaxID=1765024 RepID=UPI00345BC306
MYQAAKGRLINGKIAPKLTVQLSGSTSREAQQSLQQRPCAGSAFVFCNRANNRIKVLLWDGTGVWLCQRRLHQGKFVWPKLNECSFELTQAQWNWLIAGVNWQRLSALPPAHLEV